MIYFIQAINGGPIKIGHTHGSPRARLAQLQVGSPVELVLLAAIEGDESYEWALHERFRRYRSHGEWFHPDPEILAMIARKPLADDSRRGVSSGVLRLLKAWHKLNKEARQALLGTAEALADACEQRRLAGQMEPASDN